jgi:hypothetical protein
MIRLAGRGINARDQTARLLAAPRPSQRDGRQMARREGALIMTADLA